MAILILVFLAGCVTGWVYETVFYFFDLGYFVKRGQGFGPWLPIYGFGALGIVALMQRWDLTVPRAFAVGAIGCGLFEYTVGWVLYTFDGGLRLWDYNVEILNWGNIGGFVCLRSMLVFGLLAVFFVAIVIPTIERAVDGASAKRLLWTVIPVATLLFADVSWGYLIHPFI